jgi:hypothetical protein
VKQQATNKQNIRSEVQMIQVSKIEMGVVNLVQDQMTKKTSGAKAFCLTLFIFMECEG